MNCKGLRTILVALAFIGVLPSVLAEDIDLTAEFRAAYEADPSSVVYTDGGHYASEGITPYTAFDGNTSQRWLGLDTAQNYFQIEVPEDLKGDMRPLVRSIRFFGVNLADRAPKSVRLLVSEDGDSWTHCGAETELSFSKTQEATFEIENPHYGRFMRIELLENNGDGGKYRYNVNEIYLYGEFAAPTIAVCDGRDATGRRIGSWQYPTSENGSITLVPPADMSSGASKFACIGYELESSVDGGETWTSKTSSEKSVTLPENETLYRLTWRWQEMSDGADSVVYVSENGDGSDGSSWGTAFKSLDALSPADGTFVKVAGGRYAMDAGLVFDGKTGITVSGGWNPSADICDPTANPTVLTTSPGHAGVACSLISASNVRLSGLRFVECVNDTASAAAEGSAVYLNGASAVTFEDCLFRCCIAQSRADKAVAAARGGAVCSSASSDILFEHCDFEGNRAQAFPSNGADGSSTTYEARGGAVAAIMSESKYQACRFVGNQAVSIALGAAGGAVHSAVADAAKHRDRKAVFNNCLFAANQVNSRKTFGFLERSGVVLRNSFEYVGDSYSRLRGSAISGYCLHVFGSTFAANRGTAIFYESTSSKNKGLGTINGCKFFEQPTRYEYGSGVEEVEILWNREVTRADVAAFYDALELYVSPTGDDAASGTAAAPLKTISAALARAVSGTTIHVAAGTYGADETFPLEVRGRGFVTLTGEPGTIVDAGGSSRVLELVDSGYVTIAGIELTGGKVVATDGLGGGVMVLASTGIRFEDVSIVGNSATLTASNSGRTAGAGLYVASGAVALWHSSVSSNTLGTADYQSNAYGAGIAAETSSLTLDGCRVSGNLCDGSYTGSHNAHGAGVHFGSMVGSVDRLWVANSVIDGNLFGAGYYDPKFYNRIFGLAVNVSGANAFVNCTLISNAVDKTAFPTDAVAIAGDVVAVTNCLSFGHTYDFPSTATGGGNAYMSVPEGVEEIGMEITDPGFASGTFMPTRKSVLVNAGVDVGWTSVDVDFYGQRRQRGGSVDIGAAEAASAGVLIFFN